MVQFIVMYPEFWEPWKSRREGRIQIKGKEGGYLILTLRIKMRFSD